MIRRIFTFPDPILATEAVPVRTLDGQTVALLDDLAETMYAAPGIGLAATQIGVAERVMVLDVPETDGAAGTGLLKLVNPVIAERDGVITWEEGCLSVPDFTAMVERARHILLRGWTPEQKEIELEANGLLAVVLQHELDHLDGKLFIDHLSRLKRDLYRKRQRKLVRQGRPSGSGKKSPHLI
jgi:peptide deformylase